MIVKPQARSFTSIMCLTSSSLPEACLLNTSEEEELEHVGRGLLHTWPNGVDPAPQQCRSLLLGLVKKMVV